MGLLGNLINHVTTIENMSLEQLFCTGHMCLLLDIKLVMTCLQEYREFRFYVFSLIFFSLSELALHVGGAMFLVDYTLSNN
jgi:hypothetical protein